MEQIQVSQFIALYGSKFPTYSLPQLSNMLRSMDYSIASVQMAQMKDPTISLILSILLGGWGIDRFYVGNIMLGVLKLITCGGLGIWTIIDWFLIMGATKDKNLEMMTQLSMQANPNGYGGYNQQA